MKPHILLYLILLSQIAALRAVAQSTNKKSVSVEATDSLFVAGQWEKARAGYETVAKQDPGKMKALTWNRLGYCYQNLANFNEALKNYKKAMAANPPAPLKPFLTSRMARSYSQLHENDKAIEWLDSAVRNGYSNLGELDTLSDYNPIRKDERFSTLYKKVYSNAYPCSSNPRNREFDFWIGEWNVFKTGTTSPLGGHSVIQNASKGCLVLENWTSMNGPYEGKSMNYLNSTTGKWEQMWVGSGSLSDFIKFENGEYKDGAMRFTFEPAPVNGQKALGRLTFFNQGPNQVRQFSEQSLDQGKTWQTNYDLTYLRISKP